MAPGSGYRVWSRLLGFSVPDSVLRYAPQPLAASFGIAVVGVGGGLVIVCTGRIRALRLLLGGLLIGAAIAGTNLALVLSVRVGGTVSLQDNLFATAVGAAMVTAGVLAGLLVGLRRIWVALAAAALLGLTITATHYLTMGSVRVELGVGHPPIVGVTPILLFAVVILFSTTALALLWFFTVGTATRSDLRAVFATPHQPIDIEPWMIEEVTTRIAIGTTLTAEDADGTAAQDAAPIRRTRAPRPTPGFASSPRSRPAWATTGTTAAMASNGAAMAANGRLGRADRTNSRTPVPWVSNHPIPVEPAAATLSSTMDAVDAVDAMGARDARDADARRYRRAWARGRAGQRVPDQRGARPGCPRAPHGRCARPGCDDRGPDRVRAADPGPDRHRTRPRTGRPDRGGAAARPGTRIGRDIEPGTGRGADG